MAIDISYTINMILLPLVVSIASVVIWELLKLFVPSKYYSKFTKFKRKYHLRKTKYPTKILQSYEIIKEGNIIPIIRERMKNAFKEFKIEFIESNGDRLSFQILKEGILCKFYISLLDDNEIDEDENGLLLKLDSTIRFNELKYGLDVLFWGLTDFYEALNDYIIPESKEIKVRIDIKEMNLISELFEESGSTVIVSKHISLKKEYDHTKLILTGRRGPELSNKIRNIIILGSFQ